MGYICAALPPRNELIMLNPDKTMSDCMLDVGHSSAHLIRRGDGKLFTWEMDWTCDCCTDDQRECFVFGEVSDAQGLQLMQEAKR